MDKLEKLKEYLIEKQNVAIAYSGGCDSHFLYSVAVDTLGKDHVLAVLCLGDMMSEEDQSDAISLLHGGQYVKVKVDPLSIEAFHFNHRDRCYHCKKMIMSRVIDEAHKLGYTYVLDGQNLDDQGVYRPGIQACKELGILSPMASIGLTKQDIRRYSKELHIETYAKPSNACLASRFPYATELTKEKLLQVSLGEKILHNKGILHCRLRVHDDLARIEVEKKDFHKLLEDITIIEELEKLGFNFITLDMKGITSGSYDKKIGEHNE